MSLSLSCDKKLITNQQEYHSISNKNELYLLGYTYTNNFSFTDEYCQEVFLTGYDNEDIQVLFDDKLLEEKLYMGYRAFEGQYPVQFNQEYKIQLITNSTDTTISEQLPDSTEIFGGQYSDVFQLRFENSSKPDYMVINVYGKYDEAMLGQDKNYLYKDTTIAFWGTIGGIDRLPVTFFDDLSEIYIFAYAVNGTIPKAIDYYQTEQNYKCRVCYYTCAVWRDCIYTTNGYSRSETSELLNKSNEKFKNYLLTGL